MSYTPPTPAPKPEISQHGKERQALLDSALLAMAREIAMDLHPVDVIVKRYGYSGAMDERFQAVARTPPFQKALTEATSEWQAASSTAQRIRLKAMMVIEEGLPAMHQRIHTEGGAAIDAFKVVSKLSGLEPVAGQQGGPGAGGGAAVQINIRIAGRTIIQAEAVKQPVVDGFAEAVESAVVQTEPAQ